MYRDDDRRAKQDGTHLEHAVRVRFTEAEDQRLERMAAMYTAGRKAPWIRKCTLLGQAVYQARHKKMLANVIEGREITEEDMVQFAQFLAAVIEHEVTSIDQAM